MEGGVLHDRRVKKAMKDLVEVWLHYDHKTKGSENLALQRRLVGGLGNPYWAIIDPATERVLREQRFTMDVETFVRFLRGE